MKIHKINNWNNYVRLINEQSKISGSPIHTYNGKSIYRGQVKKNWKLSSSLERKFIPMLDDFQITKDFGWFDSKCNEILDRFREGIIESNIQVNINLYNDYELWALGRHYNLLTPLLDWTHNPFVAAFFAFFELYSSYEHNYKYDSLGKGKYVFVYRLHLNEEIFKENEFEFIKVKAKIGSRLYAQQGVFTILKHSNFMDIESYLRHNNNLQYLEIYQLAMSMAPEVFGFLEQMNIKISTLFPDLNGAALQANIDDNRMLIEQDSKLHNKK